MFSVATFNRSSITIDIWAGYHKSSQIYYNNGKPRDITLIVEGRESQHRLDDRMSVQSISVDELENCDFIDVEIYISSVYEGKKRKDTCISDIQVR